MKNIISIYNNKRSLFAKKEFLPPTNVFCSRIAIVIPAYNEYPGIFKTLNSLAKSFSNAKSHCGKSEQIVKNLVTVVVVINSPINASKKALENNDVLYKVLTQKNTQKLEKACQTNFPFNLYACYLKNDEYAENITKKKLGVGYARRYGMDLSVLYGAKVLACMDADTLVSTNYIESLIDFYKNKTVFGICKFEHQKVNCEAKNAKQQQQAIVAYEKYIKKHSDSLKKTGTPYWAYALGPTIVCDAESYAAVGGMPIRQAGEDFYFIQALEKLFLQRGNKKMHILDCTVFPSSRQSTRVPFGTGQVLADAIDLKSVPSVYSEQTYLSVKNFISVMNKSINEGRFDMKWELLPKNTIEFLKNENFEEVWNKLVDVNKKNSQKLEIAFHVWFDGLKIIRLMHFLENDTSQIFDV